MKQLPKSFSWMTRPVASRVSVAFPNSPTATYFYMETKIVLKRTRLNEIILYEPTLVCNVTLFATVMVVCHGHMALLCTKKSTLKLQHLVKIIFN